MPGARWARPGGQRSVDKARWARPRGQRSVDIARWTSPCGQGPVGTARWTSSDGQRRTCVSSGAWEAGVRTCIPKKCPPCPSSGAVPPPNETPGIFASCSLRISIRSMGAALARNSEGGRLPPRIRRRFLLGIGVRPSESAPKSQSSAGTGRWKPRGRDGRFWPFPGCIS